MKFVLFLISIFYFSHSYAMKLGSFSARVTKVNKSVGLIRLLTEFANMKYLNKKDKVEFWHESNAQVKCKGYVIGKTTSHILIKVPEYDYCRKFIYIAEGGYLGFFSQDLENNIKMGRELIAILLKKRLALSSKVTGHRKELDAHVEKVNAVNMRYKVLRDKLEAEWREELANLEEDRLITFQSYKELEARLLNIEHKLEKYRVEDKNLEEDRWSLDPKLYFHK